MPIPMIAWEVGAIVVGSLAKAFSYEKSDAWTPQEEQYAATVERYKQIREQRQAAISFAAGLSGLPESTFYGRKGLKLMRSDVPVGFTEDTAKNQPVVADKAKDITVAGVNAISPFGPDITKDNVKEQPVVSYADAAKTGNAVQQGNIATIDRRTAPTDSAGNPTPRTDMQGNANPDTYGVKASEFASPAKMSESDIKKASDKYNAAVQVEREREQAKRDEDKKKRDAASYNYHVEGGG